MAVHSTKRPTIASICHASAGPLECQACSSVWLQKVRNCRQSISWGTQDFAHEPQELCECCLPLVQCFANSFNCAIPISGRTLEILWGKFPRLINTANGTCASTNSSKPSPLAILAWRACRSAPVTWRPMDDFN